MLVADIGGIIIRNNFSLLLFHAPLVDDILEIMETWDHLPFSERCRPLIGVFLAVFLSNRLFFLVFSYSLGHVHHHFVGNFLRLG